MTKSPNPLRPTSNRILRHTLEQDPEKITAQAVRQALGWTLDALKRDIASPSIPAAALEARIDAAIDASDAMMRRPPDRARALKALQRFWKAEP